MSKQKQSEMKWISKRSFVAGCVLTMLTVSIFNAFFNQPLPKFSDIALLPTTEKEINVDHTVDELTQKQQEHGNVPKQIFMFWDRGFDHPSAQKSASTCLQSFQLINPTWTLRPLNMTQANELTDRPNLIPSHVWDKIGMAGKADIYRILLLQKYGGVWADASVFCSVPLDSWLSTEQLDLFTFTRFDNMGKQRRMNNLNPWMASWFLASPPSGYTLTKIKDIITDPKNFGLFTSEYFWFHRLFAKLVASDERIRRRAYLFPSADAGHCRTHDFWRTAPVFKRCAKNGRDLFSHVVSTSKKCCTGTNNIYNTTISFNLSNHSTVTVADILQAKESNNFDSICRMWDCSTLGPNLALPSERQVKGLRNIKGGQAF